jgi:hypothetical protein
MRGYLFARRRTMALELFWESGKPPDGRPPWLRFRSRQLR